MEPDADVLLGRPGEWVTISESGIECRFWIDAEPDPVQAVILESRSFYELDLLRALRELVPESPRVVDAGANIGNHSVFFARICGAEWLLPIEPNPAVLPELRANLGANGCETAVLDHLGLALGAKRDVLGLRLSGADRLIRNRGGARLVEEAEEGEAEITVVPLDDLVDGRVDLLKIDVEGMAVEVLRGAEGVLASSKPLLAVEVGVEEMPAFWEWAGETGYQLLAAFADYPGLTNIVLRPATRARGSGPAGSDDAEARMAQALSAAAVANAEVERANLAAARFQEAAEAAERETAELSARAEDDAAEAASRIEVGEQALAEAETRIEVGEQALAEAETRIAALEARSAELQYELVVHGAELQRLRLIEDSLVWRATYPLRRLIGMLPVSARRGVRAALRRLAHQVRRIRDAVRWRPTRRGQAPAAAAAVEDRPSAPPDAAVASDGSAQTATAVDGDDRRRAFVIDSRWPEPDRDSGSVDAMNLLGELSRLGYQVTFFAIDPESDDKYRDHLEELGVDCLPCASPGALKRFLKAEGESLELCVLSRVHSGGVYFEEVRRLAGGARLVFNTVDLHFLREEREASLAGDSRRAIAAGATQERELYLVRQADVTIVVSAEERRLLEDAVPGARVAELPLAREPHPPATPFGPRKGVGFVGSFAHLPNVDSVQFLVGEVWPIVLRELPDCELTIVGTGLPPGALGPAAGVRYLGHVPDLEPWFEGLRATIAPLRYGAGAKGKIVSSLAHGVPCVATEVAVEGMGLAEGDGVLIGATADDLAARLVEVYGDPELWSELSSAGFELARREFSLTAWQEGFRAALNAAGVRDGVAEAS